MYKIAVQMQCFTVLFDSLMAKKQKLEISIKEIAPHMTHPKAY